MKQPEAGQARRPRFTLAKPEGVAYKQVSQRAGPFKQCDQLYPYWIFFCTLQIYAVFQYFRFNVYSPLAKSVQ
jgi:hypothetical protein